ncbi:MAG: ABC transporter permease [Streptosporangiaceae bacterium]
MRTGDEQARVEVRDASTALTGVTTALLAFAAVAMFVAAIVIANTFAILLAGRTRELALLRCVGATREQVFRSVLLESAVLGLVGSVVGVLLGFGFAEGAGLVLSAVVGGFPIDAVRPSVAAVVVPLVVGVVVTVAAAVLPARAATRVAPIAALRQRSERTGSRRVGLIRLIVATIAIAAGTVALLLGTLVVSSNGGFIVAFVGGALAFGGILLAGPVVIPRAIRLVGWLPGRVSGVPARLASRNAVRNPRRAAATTSALLVGATLISLLTVASVTLRTSVTTTLDETYPVDYVVGTRSGPVPRDVVEALRDEPRLAAVATLHEAKGRVDGHRVGIAGVDPSALRRVTDGYATLRHLRPGEAILAEDLARELGAHPGDTVRVDGGGGAKTLTVRAVGDLLNRNSALATTQRDFAGLFAHPSIATVLAKERGDVETSGVTAAIDRATAGSPNVVVTGAAELKASYEKVLDTMLLIVSALLGVAVLIAFVGIANTLALSVIERRRESALLRALGLTGGQLRAMFSGEAVLMAGVGGALGVCLGVVFGWAAVASLFPSSVDVVLSVPVARMVLFVVVAGLAGLIASVLPARRATQAPVAAGLAEE